MLSNALNISVWENLLSQYEDMPCMDKLVLSLMVMEMKTQLIECCKITYDNEDGDDGDVGDVGDGGDDGDGGDGGDDEDETSSMNRLADHLLLALHYRRCQRRTQVTKQSKELYF